VLLPLQPAEDANANNVQDPTLGISWNDVLAFLIEERTQALKAAASASASNSSANGSTATQSAPTSAVTPTTVARVATPTTTQASSTPTPSGAVAAAFTPPPSPELTTVPQSPVNAPNGNTIPTGLDWGAIITPLLCGFVLLILLVVAIRFIRTRRRQNALV
jgi:hypothetical protein